ncbi:MAG: hypothetical protein K0R00_176 [Herbinix sp.]|jgi:hypothetical protein|nr:hypothetical protein [Herbinix sp.]
MLFAEEILQKYAARKKSDFGNMENGMKPEAIQERELIRKVQQNNDFMAFKELQMKYRNIINSSISKSGLTSVMDYNTALQESNRAFKELITKNFDLTKPVQPSTYIFDTLPNVLRKIKYNNRDFVARKSEELSMHSEVVATARNFLVKEYGRQPTIDEIDNFVKTQLGTGKSLTPEKIKRIDVLDRKELSGNVQVGGTDNTSGADFITWQDITNVNDETPEEAYEIGLRNQQLEEIINKLPKQERRFIRSYYGLGEFKGKKAASLYSASIDNGITYYEAGKVIDKFNQMRKDANLM